MIIKLSPDKLIMILNLFFLVWDPHGTTGSVCVDQSASLKRNIREQATTEERASRRGAHTEDVVATLARRRRDIAERMQ